MFSNKFLNMQKTLRQPFRRPFRGWKMRIYAAISTLVLAFLVILLTTNHAYITTPSMYPTIPPGSMVFIESQPRYHVGEVIEFRANGLLWIHRFVGVRPNGSYITKGDNPQSTPDVFVPELTASDVVGRVTTSVPYLGFPELFVHSPRYALQWFQAELGLRGRLALFAVAVGLAILLLANKRKTPEDAPIVVDDDSLPASQIDERRVVAEPVAS